MTELAIVAAAVLAFGLVSLRTSRWPVTAPMVFVAVGLLTGPQVTDIASFRIPDAQVLVLAEATLAIILFADAARIDLGAVRRYVGIPARLLLVALPLVIVLGTVLVRVLLDVPWSVAALVAAILAPTDAALGQPVLADERVPIRVRASLNVESGLNDGLTLPAVTLFVAVSPIGGQDRSVLGWIGFLAEQIGLGAVAGVVVGLAGGWLLAVGGRAGWMDGVQAQLGALALVGLAYAGAHGIGGNTFIAAFAAGLAFDEVAPAEADARIDFSEDVGRLLALLTFVVFGNVLVGPALGELTWPIVACSAAMLTVGRMVPVAIALVGTGLRAPTVAFLGWFGPRGLASVVFGLLVLEQAGGGLGHDVFDVIALTVLGSVVAHGVSAAPLAAAYAEWYQRHRAAHGPMGEDASAADGDRAPRVRWMPSS